MASPLDTLPQGQRSMAFAYQSIVRRIPIAIAPVIGGAIIMALGTLYGIRVAIFIGVLIAFRALVLQASRYRVPSTASVPLGLREIFKDLPQLSATLKALSLSDIGAKAPTLAIISPQYAIVAGPPC
jgi:MFS family permease